MMVMLRAQEILVLSKTALQNGKLERVSGPAASLSALGQRALRRATIEAERRMCGNVTGADGEGNVSGARGGCQHGCGHWLRHLRSCDHHELGLGENVTFTLLSASGTCIVEPGCH